MDTVVGLGREKKDKGDKECDTPQQQWDHLKKVA